MFLKDIFVEKTRKKKVKDLQNYTNNSNTKQKGKLKIRNKNTCLNQ